ncbi:MAG: DUF2157 domain-containing protein [Planctomycetia bacterium]|nr:DUF2157 domain-containing protein [Planctomycetia bacterium]
MNSTLQGGPHRPPSPRELAWLADEIPAWTREGLLTEDQARRIRARYDFAEVELDRHAGPGKLVQALSILGALLVGAGILTWIAANWDGMSDALRLGLIFTSVVGLQWGGYELAFRRANHPHVGQALLLIGNLAYGAGIFLVAQIFHLSGHWPNAFLAWGLGSLAVAVAVEAVPVFAVAAAALSVWGIGEAAEFHATGAWSLAALGALFGAAYWRRSKSHLAVAVLALAAWIAAVPGTWSRSEELLPTAWLAGSGALVAAGVLHRSLGRPDLQGPWRLAGLGGGMFAVFLLSIRPLAHEFAWSEGNRPAIGAVWALLAVAAAASAWALVVATERLARFEAWAALAATGLGATWLAIGTRGAEVPIALLFNIALFSGSAGLVALGLHDRRPSLAYSGLAWFAIGLFALYVDFGWDRLDRSLFFTVGGLLLLAGGWVLERQRRRIAATLKEART